MYLYMIVYPLENSHNLLGHLLQADPRVMLVEVGKKVTKVDNTQISIVRIIHHTEQGASNAARA